MTRRCKKITYNYDVCEGVYLDAVLRYNEDPNHGEYEKNGSGFKSKFLKMIKLMQNKMM